MAAAGEGTALRGRTWPSPPLMTLVAANTTGPGIGGSSDANATQRFLDDNYAGIGY